MVAAALSGRARLNTLTFLCHSCFNRLNYSISVGLHSAKAIRPFNTLHRCRNFFLNNCIKSIPVGALFDWPTFSPSILFISRQSISTQAFPAEFVDEALMEVLSVMANSQSSGEELCAAYVDKFCNDRNLSAAAKLLQILQDKNILLPPSAYNRLLKAAGEENDIGLLCQSFKDLLVSCKSLNSSTYLIFAQAFIKENDVACLLRFVREISESIFPSTATVMNRIIFAFADCGQVDKALMIFDQMKSLKSKPDVVTYNTILGILGRCGRTDEMLKEFVAMKEDSLIPDIVSYNTVITGLRRVGRLESCLVFFKEMCERGIKPDLRTYNALIDSFGKCGNIEESLRFFNELKLRGFRPSIHVYRSLISNLKKMGKLELAVAFSNEMKESISNHRGPNNIQQKNR
ncbi:PREDICTED: pentatricopeptide repeat-containing protein At1g11900 [Nicotiana attenuata]|uniref:Pentatricopeptide repeat-containing protein n=1 Tax=Nicotiana attenuata TaxID=49451 RepID=A0A314KXN8_NICAT|nr:PREDICTED: pentatricopeptide repeat-containing protein At1g11900 [Nicotiana attenuata]OIT34281.1 pentatricopeptide repeat-containing protein [Nicotiana attenuata]